MFALEGISVTVPPTAGSKKLKALCSIKIHDLWISGFKVIHPDNSDPYLLFPSTSYLDRRSGKVVWREILSFSEIDRISVRENILSAWRRKLKACEGRF